MSVCTTRQSNMNDNLIVLITGVASGIGLAQAKAFLQEGHKVLGIDRAKPLEDNIMSHNSFRFYQVDLTQEEQINQLFEKHLNLLEYIDVLCNTAGILDNYATIEETEVSDWQHILNTNLTSTFLMTKRSLPLLLKAPASRIINMTSIAGLTSGGGGIAYTVAKHGLVGFTKQMAYDYSHTNLRVNGIAPGAIETSMNQADFSGDQKMAKWVEEHTPIKRWAQAEEVAQLTLFLASDAADYIQASIIPIDGGWLNR